METIIEIKDMLLEIIKYSIDICDWINFMLACKDIHKQIYYTFIFKKFTFMVFHNQTLPPCIRNNIIKYYYYETNAYHLNSPSYITTNEKYILEHCQFKHIYIWKTYGLFFQGLYLDKNGRPEIDYLKVFELIDAITTRYRVINNYNLVIKQPHIKSYNPYKLFIMTKNFIEKNKYDKLNMISAKTEYDRLIKFYTKCDDVLIYRFTLKKPECEINTCAYCNEKYIDDKLQFHKNWLMIYGIHIWDDRTRNTYLDQKDYKTNSFYQPKCHEICKKIENI